MKPEINRIVAHWDWDGVVGAGLLSRIYDLPLEFPTDLKDLTIENAACIEITPGRVKSLRNSLIVDHHGTQPRQGPDKQGNEWILEPEYKAVSSLIADYWQLEFPEEWRTAVEEVDTANLNSELAATLWRAYRTDTQGFPHQQVAEMVKKGNWKEIQEWAEKQQAEYQKVQEKAKELVEKSQKLTADTAYFTYKSDDRWERGASKDAILMLKEKASIAVSIGMEKQTVKKGTIATNKNIDLTKIDEHLNSQEYKSGGHEAIVGFQPLKDKTLEQTLKDLENALKQLQKRI
nr:DHH family phosphoesterase [Candidatus Freyarchaeota archaeon]